jgi:hypothetical protein
MLGNTMILSSLLLTAKAHLFREHPCVVRVGLVFSAASTLFLGFA